MNPFGRSNSCRAVAAVLLCGLTLACSSTKPAKRVAKDPRGAYEWAMKRIDQGKCIHAAEALRLLSLEHAGAPHIDSIVYQLARAYMCSKEFALAQIEYERVINNYPTSALVDEAAFGLAYAQFKQAPSNPGLDQQEAARAVRTLEDFIAIYPLSDRREEAQELLADMKNRLARKTYDTGRLYLKLRAGDAAMIYFQQLWDEYTESPYAARALWLLAEKARKDEMWDLAIERYEQLIQVYPNSVEVGKAEFFLKRIRAKSADGIYKQAEKARRDGELTEALMLYDRLLTKYPEYKKAEKARKRRESVQADLAAGAESKAP